MGSSDLIVSSFKGEYDFLSNFYICNLIYDGITYTSAEAAFQAQKDLTRAKEFAKLSPSSVKKLGRKVNIRHDWESVKVKIMHDIVYAKFSQNSILRDKLLNTKPLLVEGNTWNDTFWGVCNGVGKNMLGRILMQVRNELAIFETE